MASEALLLVHRGSASTSRLAKIYRDKGFEPLVFSSAPFDDGSGFAAICRELGVVYAIGNSVATTTDQVRQAFGAALEHCRFCFGVWEGQRAVMAELNQLFGARDASAEAVRQSQDKFFMRTRLREHGLSAVAVHRLDDPELQSRLERGERLILKPRRGAGSLLTRVVTSLSEVEALAAAFGAGPSANDLFAEFFFENELIAESFVDGRELSLEMILQGGKTVFACEHEKTVLEFIGSTVLERGLASPAVALSAEEVRGATELAERTLAALGLADGCYHVELRVRDTGESEIIEVNPRIGGGLIGDSVQQQFGRSMVHDWIDILDGKPPAVGASERKCGIYFQLAYPEQGRQVLALHKNEQLPKPETFVQVVQLGASARGDREDIAAMTLWRTELDSHRVEVAKLAASEYATFTYARKQAGASSSLGATQPAVFLVFEPINHMYKVIEAASRRGLDVLVLHSQPLISSGPYASCLGHISEAHKIADWDHNDANFDRLLEMTKGRRVVGTYAAHEVTLEFEARVQEHFGLPTKTLEVVRNFLNKVTVRRRLAEHGLTRLRVLEQPEAEALSSWPVGERALFFKPIRGAGSAYVTRCQTLAELKAAIAQWQAAQIDCGALLRKHLDNGAGFFVEEEAVGELLSVEGYVYRGQYHLVGLTSRTVLQRDIAVEMGATFPYEHPRQEEIVDKVRRIHEALGVAHGPTHAEVVVPRDGEIELVELNLRFIGADVLMLINAAYGVNMEDDLVALAVGDQPQLRFGRNNGRFACLQYLLPPAGVQQLDSFELPEQNLPFVKIIKPTGSKLASTDFQLDWIAGFVTCGATYRDALERGLDIRQRTLVNGRPLGNDPNNVVIGR
jgi:biotin carboxylase